MKVQSEFSNEKIKEIHGISQKIISKTKLKILDNEKKEIIEKVVDEYLLKHPEVVENTDIIDSKKASELVTTAILINVSGNEEQTKMIVSKINNKNIEKVIDNVVDTFIDEVLPKTPAVSTSTDLSIQMRDIPQVIENKSPEHIFEYRQKNIEINLKKDILNTFKILENREGGLAVEDIKFIEKSSPPGEILKSDVVTIEVTLRDENGKKHNVKIDIPKINEYGVFTVNGKTKCLINQIVQLPITFPKPYDSKFESSYGAFHIVSKKERARDYLQVFIGSYKLPLFVVMAARYGIDQICHDFKIKYRIEEKTDTSYEYKIKLANKKFLFFDNVKTTVQKELVNSLMKISIAPMNINLEITNPDFFNKVILKITGRVNSVYRIQSSFDNIIDPIVKQILLNKQLPTTLDKVMLYMAEKVVDGYVIPRNDLSNQRIRNSEVIAQLVQQQVHTAYTIYKEQLLSGNTSAKFNVPQTKVLTEFVNSEIVANMEYANPIEEMSVMTRVSPIGSQIGGIPDKRAMGSVGRDVSDTQFGNIDTLDTPEGGNVGITSHLSINSDITSTRGMFKIKQINNDEKSGVLSTSTSLVPFISVDDGTRIMYGVNQARQSLPLKHPRAPLVQSGYESILTRNLSDNFIKKSLCDGVVKEVKNKKIIIECSDSKKKEEINIEERHLVSGSGKNTLSIFRPIVKPGQKIKKGDLVAEGSCVKNGMVAVGQTLCTAVMSYKGFNFEDGIVISESLVKSEKLTSLHGIIEEIFVEPLDKILYIAKPGTYIKKGEPLFRKVVGDVNELLGDIVSSDNLSEVSGGQYIKKSPGGRLINIDVFSNEPLTGNLQILQSYANKTRKKMGMKNDDLFRIKKEVVRNIIVKFVIEQELPVSVGDKLSNSHGAKGIISLIEKDKYMPLTPWGDRVEIIVNPIGIINRMNVGQLYELYAGLISNRLGYEILKLRDKSKVIDLLKKVLPILDKTNNKLLSTNFLTKLERLSQTKFSRFLDEVKENNGFILIIPPFKEPNRKDLMQALKVLNLKPKYNLFLPEYNVKTIRDVAVGYVYFKKLEHIASDKLTARSTGPVTSKTLQPVAGKKNKGGQRVGEMDVYSLLSYNAKLTLTELFGPLSDDLTSKNEYIANIVQNGHTPFLYSGHTASKDLLNNYMMALMLSRG